MWFGWYVYSACLQNLAVLKKGERIYIYIFNLDIDDLSKQLEACNAGCMIVSTLVNHIMYANSPCSTGL